jgi:hypothetical protein
MGCHQCDTYQSDVTLTPSSTKSHILSIDATYFTRRQPEKRRKKEGKKKEKGRKKEEKKKEKYLNS